MEIIGFDSFLRPVVVGSVKTETRALIAKDVFATMCYYQG